ncbi:MAG TPA: SBBP repeat-containing protein [Terriglobia bacterium]|nr:SBBP repeat-containing protein [Terriglobia bacterium]
MLTVLLTLMSALVGLAVPRPSSPPGAPAKAHAVRLNVAARARLATQYGELPLSFEMNEGQADRRARFVARGSGYVALLEPEQIVLRLRPSSGAKRGASLGITLVNANRDATVSGVDLLPGKSNYFVGQNPAGWHTNIPTYSKVRYAEVYRGVDLMAYGNQRQLEYDFVLAPHSDVGQLRLRLDGARRLTVDAQGNLAIATAGGDLRFLRPVAYQGSDPAARRLVRATYILGPHHEIGFKVASYDARRPLVIDPVLSYSTFLGGSGGDVGEGIAVDASGNAYVTGATASLNFPTSSPLQSTIGGGEDAFVAKLNAAGTALTYSTYLGGSGDDFGNAIAIDSSGNAYVTGNTASTNFPTTTGAFQTKYGGSADAFVAVLNPSGAALVYSSYLGGSGSDFGQGIAVDSSGNAYVTGSTDSTDFPTAKPLQSANGGASDAFVAKVNSSGSTLVYSTYLGGASADAGQAIAVDGAGNAYVAGATASANFPVANAFQPASGGGDQDAFVSKLSADGSTLVYSTYLGGSGADRAFGITLDSAANAYVVGDTTSANFPTTSGVVQASNNGSSDAFASKLNAAGSALVYSTLLGGSDLDRASAVAVDASGHAFITGLTQSGNFPTAHSVQTKFGGGTCGSSPCSDAFVAELDPPAASLVYSTYLGGSGADAGQAIALDSSGNAYVAGGTASSNFIAVGGAFQGTYGGVGATGNAFVTKISGSDAPALAATPQSINFGNQALDVTSAAQTVTVTNAGSAALQISSVTASSLFAETNTCTGPVAAGGGTCTISVTFTPTSAAAETGQITINDNAAGSPHVINLSGTGVAQAAAVTFSPTSLTFPNTAVGATSASQTVTVTNSGSATLTFTTIAATGDYSETNNCGTSLAVNASCVVTVIFKPTQTGTRSGAVTFTDNGTSSPQTVSLTGNGTPVFALTSTATSNTIVIGTTSTTFTVAASAPSGFTSSITLSCEAGVTCSFSPASITPGQSSTLTVSALSGTSANPTNLTVDGVVGTSGSAGSQTAKLPLSVYFQDFTVAVTPTLNTVVAGNSVTYSINVGSVYGFNQAVALSCSSPGGAPLPPHVTCAFAPASVTPSGSTAGASTVTIGTAKNTTASAPGAGPSTLPWSNPPSAVRWSLAAWMLAILAVVGGWAASRRRTANGTARSRGLATAAFLATVLLFVALWSACYNYGVGPYNGPGAGPGTPSGNYHLTFTGTLGTGTTAVTRSITVNLSVT